MAVLLDVKLSFSQLTKRARSPGEGRKSIKRNATIEFFERAIAPAVRVVPR